MRPEVKAFQGAHGGKLTFRAKSRPKGLVSAFEALIFGKRSKKNTYCI
jgi:hypothetical protein